MRVRYLILAAIGCAGIAYSAWNPFKKKSWDKVGDAITDTAKDVKKDITNLGKDIALAMFDINEDGIKSDVKSLLADADTMLENVSILKKSFTGSSGIITRVETVKKTLNDIQTMATTLSFAQAAQVPAQVTTIVDNISAIDSTIQKVPGVTADLLDAITAILRETLDIRAHLGKAGQVAMNEDLYKALKALARNKGALPAPLAKLTNKPATQGTPAPLVQFATTLRQLDLHIEKERLALELGVAVATRTAQIPVVVKTIQSYVDTFNKAVDLAGKVKAIKKQGLELKDTAEAIPGSIKGSDPLGNLYKQLVKMNGELSDVITKAQDMIDALSVQIQTASIVLKSFKENLNVDIYKPGTIGTLDSLVKQINELNPLFNDLKKALKKPITHWTAFKELMT